MNTATSITIAQLTARIRAAEEALRPIRAEPVAPMHTGWKAIARQTLHEWFAEAPPLMLLTDMVAAAAELRAGYIFWVGRSCWPYAPHLGRGKAGQADVLHRSVFVDVPSRERDARTWAIDLILRSPATVALVADGRRLEVSQSRRLQLASESGPTLAMLWRHEREVGATSVAHVRWRVTPMTPMATQAERFGWMLGESHQRRRGPAWRVEQLRCKGGVMHVGLPGDLRVPELPGAGGEQTVMGDATEARGLAAVIDRDGQNPSHARAGAGRVFFVEHDDDQGIVLVPADVVDRPRSPSLSQIA